MRIAVDMQGLQTNFSGGRGVGRYTKELIREFIKLNNKKKCHEIFLVLNSAFPESILKIKNDFCDILDLGNILIWQNNIDTALSSNPKKIHTTLAEINREIFLWSLQADIIFSTNLQENIFENAVTAVKAFNYGAYYITTLHDVVPFYYPEYNSDKSLYNWYHEKIEQALKSDMILTVSNSSKADIIKFLEVEEDKLFVVPNGVNFENKIEFNKNIDVLKKYNIEDKFIFYIGGVEKHKNIPNLIRAFANKKELYEHFQLVLAGTNAKADKDINDCINLFDEKIKNRIHFPGRIDDIDLPQVYNLSTCFVFPSTHEGFGLPALEGMAYETAVLGANQSSIKEIINNDLATFDPYDYINMSELIYKTVSDKSFNDSLCTKGMEQAKLYTWEKSALILDSIIDKIEMPTIESFSIESLLNKLENLETDDCDLNILEIVSYDIRNSILFSEKNIYIDISAVILQDDKSGIQRVVRAISSNMYRLKPKNIFLVYSTPNDLDFKIAYKYMKDNFNIENELFNDDFVVSFNNGDTLLYLDLHPANAIAHEFYNQELINRGVNVYHLIYDLIPIFREKTFWTELVEEFKLWVKSICKSSGAICISKSVSDDLNNYLNEIGCKEKSFKIMHFHLGADIKSSLPTKIEIDDDKSCFLDFIKNSITFLMVGTIEPRKGYIQTLKAFELLWASEKEVNLVIVGRIGWGMSDFLEILKKHKNFNNRVFFLESIDDEYLEKIYASSTCLISASEAEGFGLPLIEAAINKIPLLIRDLPVFKEVAGTHAYYFKNDNNPNILAEAIKDWLILYKDDIHPKSNDMPWLTWEESAKQLLNKII